MGECERDRANSFERGDDLLTLISFERENKSLKFYSSYFKHQLDWADSICDHPINTVQNTETQCQANW